jgi:hypothetical protein
MLSIQRTTELTRMAREAFCGSDAEPWASRTFTPSDLARKMREKHHDSLRVADHFSNFDGFTLSEPLDTAIRTLPGQLSTFEWT